MTFNTNIKKINKEYNLDKLLQSLQMKKNSDSLDSGKNNNKN